MRYETLKYDTKKYDFVKVVKEVVGVEDLGGIKDTHHELYKVGADSQTSYHHLFYNKYREGWPEMELLYERFIKEVISPMYNEGILYQKFPTLRVHLKGNVAVGAFHNDAEFGHPAGEMNYIIPLTNSDDTASCWVESKPGKKDFKPIKMRVGRLIKFNGNELTHGNKVNETDATRVSMDFRILPASKYDERNNGESVTLHTKFKEGEYYKKLTDGNI